MATNKSKRWEALGVHVGVYSVVIGMSGYALLGSADHAKVTEFFLLTFATHFVTDAVTSRITSRLWFFKQYQGDYYKLIADLQVILHDPWRYEGGNRHWFFVVIGADQLIHAWTLALTWMWVTR